MVVLLVMVPASAQTSKFDLLHVIASFLFVPWLHPVQHIYVPMLVVGWTLNYEMFFYVIFGLSLALLPKRRTSVVIVSSLVLLTMTLAPAAIHLTGVAKFYSSSIILEFGFGMILCEIFLRVPMQKSKIWWLFGALGVIGIVNPTIRDLGPHAISIGLPSLLVVTSALYMPLNLKGVIQRAAGMIGDASYSIYLSHFIIMSAIGQLWRKAVPQFAGSNIVFCVLATFLCTIVGIFVYRYFERNFSKITSTWFRRSAEPSN